MLKYHFFRCEFINFSEASAWGHLNFIIKVGSADEVKTATKMIFNWYVCYTRDKLFDKILNLRTWKYRHMHGCNKYFCVYFGALACGYSFAILGQAGERSHDIKKKLQRSTLCR